MRLSQNTKVIEMRLKESIHVQRNVEPLTTLKLAKNWPSTVFSRKIREWAEMKNPLCLPGFLTWFSPSESGLQPSDYESPALTAELWAQ